MHSDEIVVHHVQRHGIGVRPGADRNFVTMLRVTGYLWYLREMNHGTQDFKERFKGRRKGDAQAQGGHAQERPQWQDRQEQKAGDRDRPVGSPQQRQKGRPEEGLASSLKFNALSAGEIIDRLRNWHFATGSYRPGSIF
jgi:hypothetical protein